MVSAVVGSMNGKSGAMEMLAESQRYGFLPWKTLWLLRLSSAGQVVTRTVKKPTRQWCS